MTILLTQYNSTGFEVVSLTMTIIVVVVFLIFWGFNRISILRIRKNSKNIQDVSNIMKHTLDLSGSHVIQLTIATRHAVNMHGNFLGPEGMTYSESRKWMHPDDWCNYEQVIKEATGKG